MATAISRGKLDYAVIFLSNLCRVAERLVHQKRAA
jgi:hypothetical protein